MPTAKARPQLLGAFEQAQTELVGKAVIDHRRKSGHGGDVCLDELHGLRISIGAHEGKLASLTVKFAQR